MYPIRMGLAISFLFIVHVFVGAGLSAQCEGTWWCGNNLEPIFLPETNSEGGQNFICLTSCIDQTSLDNPIGLCEVDNVPVKWFKVELDEIASEIYISINKNGDWTPLITLYSGSCQNLIEVSNSGNPACNSEWINQEYFYQSVNASSESYWIVVGAAEFEQVEELDFELCVSTTTISHNSCQNITGCNENAFRVEYRSEDPDGSLGLSLEGPFFPEEEILICSDLANFQGVSASEFFISIIPFYDGFIVPPNHFQMQEVMANGKLGQWYNDSIPILNVDVPNLCLEKDNDDKLQLCNSYCMSCNCEDGIKVNQQMPGGYFWDRIGGGHACYCNQDPPNDCAGISDSIVSLEFCIPMIVDYSSDSYGSTSSVHFGIQKFYDAVIGCWHVVDYSCISDFPSWAKWDVSCGDIDADGDGYFEYCDCDDNDPTVFEKSREIFNNEIDENCDGVVEMDLDYDGYGSLTDCNDNDPTISPGLPEIPYNGLDDDCNPETPDDDLDGDGLAFAIDCDDMDASNQALRPTGDDPCDLWNGNGPILITDDQYYTTSTCCAVGANTGEDYANKVCSGITDAAKVWFHIIPDMFSTEPIDAYEIDFQANSTFSLEVYVASADAGCTGLFSDPVYSACASVEGFYLPACEAMDHIWISVGSTEVDCGELSLQVRPMHWEGFADECWEEDIPIMFPETKPDGTFNFEYMQLFGLEFSCPERDVFDCGFNEIPTQWVKVMTDSTANQLYVYCDTDCGWDPVFAIYEAPTGNCQDSLSVIGTAATPYCNTSWANPEQINQPVCPNTWYWIAIGADNYEPGMCGDTHFGISTTETLLDCLGEGDCNQSTDFRIYDNSANEISTQTTVFEPEDSLTICSSFLYDASESGVEWLMGIVPLLDDWNMEDFEPETIEVLANGMAANWVDQTVLTRATSRICSYIDENGVTQICNMECMPCPCDQGLAQGALLPGSWQWATEGDCNYCSPLSMGEPSRGIGSVQAEVVFCIDVIIPTFENGVDMEDPYIRFGFQTFSDGMIGCWRDPVGTCKDDPAQFIRLRISNDPAETQDLDGDGVDAFFDCDDLNSEIYPGNLEMPYNGVDDDCDPETPDDDLDGDGYGIDEDCDDLNSEIYPGNLEMPYNGVDDDCDPETPDDDLDGDGYGIDEDCDDMNSDIFPGNEEIANNGIDEDCNGEDLVSSTNQIEGQSIFIYPNPARDFLYVDTDSGDSFRYTLYDTKGSMCLEGKTGKAIDLQTIKGGLYFLHIHGSGGKESISYKLFVSKE